MVDRTESVPTESVPTVESSSPTPETPTPDSDESVAAVTITADAATTVRVVVQLYPDDERKSQPSIQFWRSVELAAGETYRVRIPAVPAFKGHHRRDELGVLRRGDASVTNISSCRVYRFTVTNTTVRHTGTTPLTSPAESSPVNTDAEDIWTEPEPGQCG